MIVEAELVDGGHGVAATYDGDRVGSRHGLGDGLGAVGEGVDLEYAHRAVPDDGFRFRDLRDEFLDGHITDVDAFPAFLYAAALAVDAGELRFRAFLEFLGDAGVGGKQELHALSFALARMLSARSSLSASTRESPVS